MKLQGTRFVMSPAGSALGLPAGEYWAVPTAELSRLQNSKIPWRGSVTDLATDCAALLTREQVEGLAHELTRFLTKPHLADKIKGDV